MIELKPCPFCGGQPEDQDVGIYFVECPSCGLEGPRGANAGRARAIEAWNRRAQPAPITSESGNQADQGASAITSESVPLLTVEQIQTAWVEHGLDDCAVEDFARAIESLVRSKLGAGVPMEGEQISDGEFTPDAKLMELADKIDHEQNWRHSGIFQRDHLTQDQKDRVLAGVMLRRYADLMAPESWRLFPPARAGAQSYRASTLDAVVKMAQKYCHAAIEAERGEG